MRRNVTAVAHRGDPYKVRENTLPSLASAFAAGADAVEIDVRLTRDGVPVLLHDATLDRLWGHDRPPGPVSEVPPARRRPARTLAALSGSPRYAQYRGDPPPCDRTHRTPPGPPFGRTTGLPTQALDRLSADEVRGLTDGGVPTLAEALEQLTAAADGTRYLIDLPDAGPETARAVVGTVRDCGAADRVYYCAGAAAMVALRAADPDAELALTRTTLAPPRAALLDAVRPRWLNYRFGLLGPDLVAKAHRDGYLVSCWTPDTRRSMRRMLALGVDAITTNRLDALHATLRAGS
ncbi:glycerophosphodiester phosphodiesterase [Streptomyces sp. NPDC002851]